MSQKIHSMYLYILDNYQFHLFLEDFHTGSLYPSTPVWTGYSLVYSYPESSLQHRPGDLHFYVAKLISVSLSFYILCHT